MTAMLNIATDELVAFAKHFEVEIKEGFGDEVEIAQTLVAGNNTLTQDQYFDVYDMLHRSLERLESEETMSPEYTTLLGFADKLDEYADAMYEIWDA